MHDQAIIGWGYRLLKILLLVLLILGVVFLLKLLRDRFFLGDARHHVQLRRLERAYVFRKERLQRAFEEKIEDAPNEILAMKYQQEQDIALDEMEELYFADKRAILEGDYSGLDTHWKEEIEEIQRGPPPDEKPIEEK